MLTVHNPSNPGDEDFCNAIEGEISVAAPTVCDIVGGVSDLRQVATLKVESYAPDGSRNY